MSINSPLPHAQPTAEQSNEAAAQFTAQQVRDWRAYEKVRSDGRYNMFDPRARRATRLSVAAYSFVMKNYSALKAQAEMP